MIDLSKLPPEGLRLQGGRDFLRLDGRDGMRELKWNFFALPSGSDVFLDIRGNAILEGTCSRCLEPFDIPLNLESQFLGSKDPALVGRGSYTLGSQDLDVVFIPEPIVDEEALVVEQFQLHAPMHPLCREECQGLCSRCGKNWNKGRCSCRPEDLKEPSALAKALAGIKLDLEH